MLSTWFVRRKTIAGTGMALSMKRVWPTVWSPYHAANLVQCVLSNFVLQRIAHSAMRPIPILRYSCESVKRDAPDHLSVPAACR